LPRKEKRTQRIARIRADYTEFLRLPSVKSVNPRNPLSAFPLLWAKPGAPVGDLQSFPASQPDRGQRTQHRQGKQEGVRCHRGRGRWRGRTGRRGRDSGARSVAETAEPDGGLCTGISGAAIGDAARAVNAVTAGPHGSIQTAARAGAAWTVGEHCGNAHVVKPREVDALTNAAERRGHLWRCREQDGGKGDRCRGAQGQASNESAASHHDHLSRES